MSIVNWIFPKYCVGCHREGKYLCNKCEEGVWANGQSLRYEGVIRKIIKEIKYRGSFDMIRELIDIWARKTGYNPEIDGKEVITSVPMWETKKRKRGFNQAELIAKELARRWHLEYQELLVRVKETKPMYGLNKQERLENIYGAFALKVPKKKMKDIDKVFLIDDVWTTGSTMRECARILKLSRIEAVWCIAIAK